MTLGEVLKNPALSDADEPGLIYKTTVTHSSHCDIVIGDLEGGGDKTFPFNDGPCTVKTEVARHTQAGGVSDWTMKIGNATHYMVLLPSET